MTLTMNIQKFNQNRKGSRSSGYGGFGGIAAALVLVLGFHSLVIVSSKESQQEQQNSKVFQADLQTDKEHEISILIGARNGETGGGGIGINADEGEEGGGGGNGTAPPASASTSWTSCSNRDSKCCFQYTWPGFTEDIPERENATCEYLKKQRKDEMIACFDPMVFTMTREGRQPAGTPPNFTDLREQARDNNWNTFCVAGSGKACLTHTYYSNSDRKVINVTKFCGVVTTTDGDRLEKGCYSQNVGGTVREICVCQGRLCNAASLLQQPSKLILTVLMFTYAYKVVFQ